MTTNTSCPHCYTGKKPILEREDEIDKLMDTRGLSFYEAMLRVGDYIICPHCKGTGEKQGM
ncbi:hypothetical protein [Bacillus sp. B1-b2]|uniref:hypothetical protein n=1 Tax=Bacillus sp. B1-b2 TaxID=2653201 RepID=UPI0012616363|nr:hypothetical protein [Bacillus sp. B1-b2]KAB7665154.1 hypothetical protein F9279_21115 [Bacillus sp. B1-b2]